MKLSFDSVDIHIISGHFSPTQPPLLTTYQILSVLKSRSSPDVDIPVDTTLPNLSLATKYVHLVSQEKYTVCSSVVS